MSSEPQAALASPVQSSVTAVSALVSAQLHSDGHWASGPVMVWRTAAEGDTATDQTVAQSDAEPPVWSPHQLMLQEAMRQEGIEEERIGEIMRGELELSEPQPPNTAAVIDPAAGGTWSDVIEWPHVPVQMAALPDGRILTWSGGERTAWGSTEQNYSAVWDPLSGEFDEHLTQGHNMFCAGISMTSEGEVFVVGGRFQRNSTESSSFDWRLNDWTQREHMAGGRWYPATLALPDGGVYTVAGTGNVAKTAERWQRNEGWDLHSKTDWTQATWYPHPNNPSAWQEGWPTVYAAPNGKLAHVGPTPRMHWIDWEDDGASTSAGDLSRPYYGSSASVMYQPGKLLSTGGRLRPVGPAAVTDAWTVDINGASPQIQDTESMLHRRAFHNLVILPNGEVAAIGGNETGNGFSDRLALFAAEIWNPDTGKWRLGAEMAVPRTYHSTALLMTDGRVISAGGGYPAANHTDGQTWMPPYFYNSDGSLATRPVISEAPTLIGVGEQMTVRSADSPTRFTFIRMGSTTHQQNTDQRFVELDFSNKGNGSYELSLPENVNVLMPGYWMLFALNQAGTPSQAHVIKVKRESVSELDNLALAARVSQSSTYSSATAASFAAEMAVDGNTTGDVSISVTHTESERNPWWQAELGQRAKIESIRLWNRTGTGTSGLRSVDVFVSDRQLDSSDPEALKTASGVWHTHVAGILGRPSEIAVGVEGRFVRVVAQGTRALSIAEVQILADSSVQVDRVDTIRELVVSPKDWQKVHFKHPFDSPPVVVMGPMTYAYGDPVFPRLRDLGSDGFEFKLTEWDYQSGTHGYEWSSLLALPEGEQDLGGLSAVAMRLRVGTGWRRIEFDTPFGETPALLTTLASHYEDEPVSVRVRNVNTRSFDVRIADEDAGDTVHGVEVVNVIAVEPGTGSYRGRELRVGRTGNSFDDQWTTLNFGETLSNPALLASINSTNSIETVVLRMRALNNDSVRLLVQEDQSHDREVAHVKESIGWMALAEPPPLAINALSATPALSGASASFNAEVTGTDLSYVWDFGDGNSSAASSSPSATHLYRAPGHYTVTLTVTDSNGDSLSQQMTQVVYLPRAAGVPLQSSGLGLVGSQVWNVNPDNDSVSISTAEGRIAEIAVGEHPVALAITPGRSQAWVVNKDSASISVVSTAERRVLYRLSLPAGSQPHGIVISRYNNRAYVALEATGEVAVFNYHNRSLLSTVAVGPRVRHLAMPGDQSTLLATRFITAPLDGESGATPNVDSASGEMWRLNPRTLAREGTVFLDYSDAEITEHSGPGLPNYLGAPSVSPDGTHVYVPSKQDAVLGGTLRSGPPLRFDQTVRAVSSRVDLGNWSAPLSNRVDHDNAGFASAAAHDRNGAWVFVALETSREVAVIDAYTGAEFSRIDVGHAPQSVMVSANNKQLMVHAALDRAVEYYDIEALVSGTGGDTVPQLAQVRTVASERLTSQVLLGKRLFHDARDTRLANLGYVSCASCHNDADTDGRNWDFSQFGEGVRNTTSLRGKGNSANGFFHWTGNFDETQDFESQIRAFGGTGLMSNTDFNASREPLGPFKRGRSADLDAIAAYLESLQMPPSNPQEGELSTQQMQSRAQLFVNKGCADCHSGEVLSDSTSGQRHDVGTATAASGSRLAKALDGFDTPALLNLSETGPYLHDGSADTVAEAIERHTTVQVSATEAQQLSDYLLNLPAEGVSSVSKAGLSNIAVNGTAKQSSSGYGGSAARAIDGNTSGRWRSRSVSHTAYESQPWWQLDLGRSSSLSAVTVFNRTDCCASRLRDLTVYVSDTDMSRLTATQLEADTTLWRYRINGVSPLRSELDLGGISGRYLRFQLAGSGWLMLAEVQVWSSGATATRTAQVKPLLSELSDLRSSEGARVQVDLSTSAQADGAVTYSASDLPQGLQIDADSGIVSGVAAQAQDTAVEITASDGVAQSSRSFQWRVESVPAGTRVLQSDTPLDGELSAGQWAHFVIDAADADSLLNVSLSQMDDDLDLYLRRDSRPSDHYKAGGDYDCHSILSGTGEESCALVNNGSHRYFVAVHANRDSRFQLSATLRTRASSSEQLNSGQPVKGVLGEGEMHVFRFRTEADARGAVFALSELDSDLDLYLRAGEAPTTTSFDCRSWNSEGSQESCAVDSEPGQTWYVGVHGYEAGSYSLSARAVDRPSTSVKAIGKAKADSSVTGGGGALVWLCVSLAVLAVRRRREARGASA